MSEDFVLAADLGGTNLRMAAIDRQGKFYTARSVKLRAAKRRTKSSGRLSNLQTNAGKTAPVIASRQFRRLFPQLSAQATA